MMRAGLFVAAAVVAFAPRAFAQPVHLTEMNFDMWCQEEQHLPPDRCDKRLPEDDKAFQAYQGLIQDYEVPYRQQREQENHFNKVILHNDPVDNPSKPGQPDNPDPPSTPPPQ